MSKQEEFKRDNFEETKKGIKGVSKLIFTTNEYIPDNWTDFDVTPEEAKILKEGEDYVNKVLAPSLSIYRKVSKEELLDNDEPVKEGPVIEEPIHDIEEVQTEAEIEEPKGRFTEAEMAEMNSVLKQKTKNLKLKTERANKEKNLRLKEEELKKKKEELERLNRE